MRLDVARPRRRLLDMTPLIDVVFNLLLFFMLASSFVEWRAIAVNVPAVGASAPGGEGALLVRVKAAGALALNGEPITLAALGERVHARLADNPEQSILVRPDQEVSVQDIVTVLDRLTAVGAGHVSLTP